MAAPLRSVADEDGSPLERARGLGPLIDASAAADETSTEVPREVVETLREKGLLSVMVPRELDGDEAHPEVLIDVIRELSYHDGSTGWYAGAVMTAGAFTGAFLGEQAIDALYRSGDPRPICAGQAAPTGKARRVDGGYSVSGRFSFGSGCPAASWLVGGYMLEDAETPTMLIGFVPRETVIFAGNWDVLGLRGTGSYDYIVAEQILPEDFFFNAAAPVQQRGGVLYRMGFMALPCLTHASFALGCAARALDEWGQFARTKLRAPGLMANELHTFQRDFAAAHGELRAAEAYVRRTFSSLFDAAGVGVIDEDLKFDGRLSACNAFTVAVRVAAQAFAGCTTHALRDGNPIQRCFRDINAGNAHFLTGEQTLIETGKALACVDGARVVF